MRSRTKASYEPQEKEYINREKKIKPITKKNIGVLEATGSIILDDESSFEQMKSWSSGDISIQIQEIIKAISVKPKEIKQFEQNIVGLFPE